MGNSGHSRLSDQYGRRPCADSLQLALRLLREAKVGVAPGTAFGPEGEGCIRMCFAISTELAREAVVRLTRFFGLAAQPT